MKSKKLKFNVYDEVITVKDHDNGGNEVFPIGTKGTIVAVNIESNYPYRVMDNRGNHWFYNDDMLKADNDKFIEDTHDIDAYKIAGDVLEKTNGYEGKIKEVIYYLNSFMNY